MGNYKFRLSDMIPNVWLNRVMDMSKSRKHYSSQSLKKKPPSEYSTSGKSNVSQQRYSYYYASEPGIAEECCDSAVNPEGSDALFPDPSMKTSRKVSKRKTIYRPSSKLGSSSFSADCSCDAALNSVWTELNPVSFTGNSSSSGESSPEPHFHEPLPSRSEADDGIVVRGTFDHQVASLSSCKFSSSTDDIVIDVNDESYQKVDGFAMIPEPWLPRISTKSATSNPSITEVSKFRRSSSKLEEAKECSSVSVKLVKKAASIRNRKEQDPNHPVRNFSAKSNGIRLRSNSPRISSRKIRASARKSVSLSRNKTLSESLAIVKYSVDPQRDFEESMMEMIVENNIRSSEDLEDLLACYLSLNSNEYHDLIVKAFEQIWYDMTDLGL